MKKKDDVNWDDISFIERAKQRKAVLVLLDKPKTPTQMKKESCLHFNTISRALVELEKKGFVVCLTPNQKLCRFYELTKKGKKIVSYLNKEK